MLSPAVTTEAERCFQPSLRDSFVTSPTPALKRRAIVTCPCRTKRAHWTQARLRVCRLSTGMSQAIKVTSVKANLSNDEKCMKN